jgi:hypothetical protein
MTFGWRRHLVKRHDFFVEQMRIRMLSRFDNIEAEAEEYAEAEYERIGSSPASEYDQWDMASVAETASENTQEYYSMLDDLRKQAILSAVAGMYHQWEKELRKFLELEMRHYFTTDAVRKHAWVKDIGNIFVILKEFGWDCTSLSLFGKIDACRLVVNVYKHGKGQSLDDLSRKYPQYLDNPMRQFKLFEGYLDYEHLSVSDAQVTEFAAALRDFWTAFPELLYWKSPESRTA